MADKVETLISEIAKLPMFLEMLCDFDIDVLMHGNTHPSG
jgi:hypothetical protein